MQSEHNPSVERGMNVVSSLLHLCEDDTRYHRRRFWEPTSSRVWPQLFNIRLIFLQFTVASLWLKHLKAIHVQSGSLFAQHAKTQHQPKWRENILRVHGIQEPVLFPIACANFRRNSYFFPRTVCIWYWLRMIETCWTNKQAFWSQTVFASHRQLLLGDGSPVHKGHLSTNRGIRQSNDKHKPACYTNPTRSMIKSPTNVLMGMPHW